MLIQRAEDLQKQLAVMQAAPLLSLDLETSGLSALDDRLLIIGLSDGRYTWLIDARRIEHNKLCTLLQPTLENCPVIVMHHARFDLRFLLQFGLFVANPVDTMLNAQLLDNGRKRMRMSLAAVAKRMIGVRMDKSEQRSFIGQADQDFSEEQLEYARRDLLVTYQIFMRQVSVLAQKDLSEIAAIEALALNAFAAMEHNGLPIDVPSWRKLSDEAKQEQNKARSSLDKIFKEVADLDLFSGVQINYDSEPELREHLARLGVEVESTSRTILQDIDHPVGQAIIAYREASKIVSTYGESFLAHVHPRTGRIHASFKQIGASTGRVACADPNLQNIPKGSSFRACIRAPQGRVLVTADYAACELRILAQASGDKTFAAAFARGEDLHASVATQMFGQPVSKTENPKLRDRAKAINFGLIYGMGTSGLAAVVGCSKDEAEDLLHKYFASYPMVSQYLETCVREALQRGYAQTLTGRKLWFDPRELRSPDAAGTLGRLAKNMPIQGSSADITKLAMARLHASLGQVDPSAAIVNVVHDEIVVEADQGKAEQVAQLVKKEMEEAEQDILPDIVPAAEVIVDESWAKA